ncbi:hypothetical protein K439DRAFT_1010258 [Ramaria rubella]|nr:hypothetical protein K439DRAFT_1010258 [Ramaria rubella]
MKDLKKVIIADQAEIKELRLKVQNANQAKHQAVSRQEEIEQLRKALHDLETKHKVELQGRDSKLLQQEKALVRESEQMVAIEQQFSDLMSNTDIEAKKARDRNHCLQEEVDALRRAVEDAQRAATKAGQYLPTVQANMTRVVAEYGHLAASSIPLDKYRQTELLCTSLRLRIIRLERRLADRDALVEQLTDYCRQASEEKSMLAGLLQEIENDHHALLNNRRLDTLEQTEDTSIISSLFDAQSHVTRHNHDILQTNLLAAEAMHSVYRTQFDDLLIAYAVAQRESIDYSNKVKQLMDGHDRLQTDFEALRSDYSAAQSELSSKSVQIAEVLAREQILTGRLATQQHDIARLEDALKKESETSGRLAQASHQSKKNEERLRYEVEELVENLADVTRYKEAHADLLSEVVQLIERNELAEAEAERLGKFNAEILSHANPQQKIFYIDRIRRELADTKHQLLRSTRDCEGLVADNAALQHEVAAYKSISVPIELKPRGNRVRIERPPLASRNVNGVAPIIRMDITPPLQEQEEQGEPMDNALMTLDEIM